MSTENVETFSAAQCRAGRALIDMTQPQLAASAGLGLSTVVDFEKSRRQLSADALTAIRRALEASGVEFTNGGQPGVRLQFIEAQPHQRDNGEWGVMARWRLGDPVSWCPTEKAFEAAQEAEGRGDIRLASALREAAEAARRHAKGRP